MYWLQSIIWLKILSCHFLYKNIRSLFLGESSVIGGESACLYIFIADNALNQAKRADFHRPAAFELTLIH